VFKQSGFQNQEGCMKLEIEGAERT